MDVTQGPTSLDENEDGHAHYAGPSGSTTQEQDLEYEGDGMECEDHLNPVYVDDNDYESEEELLMHPMDRRASLVGLSNFGSARSQPFTLPPFSSLQEGTENMVEHMEAELETLRQKSVETVSLSLRLSEQLVDAQTESSRTRATLRTIEGLLEDETRRRREAERVAYNEEKRRRRAEEALSDFLSRARPV